MADCTWAGKRWCIYPADIDAEGEPIMPHSDCGDCPWRIGQGVG